MIRGVATLNTPLIGDPGSRTRIETPALVLDAELFEASVERLATLARQHGFGVRPHAKSHKCAAIAQRLMAAGALGIACAKPGELLALFDAGITKLMLTAPVASPRKIALLAKAAAQGAEIIVVADSEALIDAYDGAALAAGTRFEVLVDCDTGLGRTGARTPEATVALARAIEAGSGLVYAGVQAYAGQVQHVYDHGERRQINDAANARLADMIAALKVAGLAPRIISGGGTGSHLLDFEAGILTEVQPGSYILMDEAYVPVDLHGTGREVFGSAMRVTVSVIAHNHAGEAITDGGSKSFAIDGPPPRAFLDGREIGTIGWAGDEFGRLKLNEGEALPPIGTRIEGTVPHCDPTSNLHDVFHVMRGDTLEAIWPIEARGRSD